MTPRQSAASMDRASYPSKDISASLSSRTLDRRKELTLLSSFELGRLIDPGRGPGPSRFSHLFQDRTLTRA